MIKNRLYKKNVLKECYEKMRTNIKYCSVKKDYNVIVITSSEPGDGKSTISKNIAISFSEETNKVILIDCDLRRPSLHKMFKISNSIGLSDIIGNRATIEESVSTYNNNLTILTSGKLPPNPAELLGSKLMENFIYELRSTYDYIILDTPPILAVTDSQILATKADGVLLVARANVTTEPIIKRSISLLRFINADIIGLVLNDVKLKL